MKLEINTTEKTITLKEKVELKELVDLLDKLLENDWEEYSVIPEYLLNSSITFPEYYPTYPTYPIYYTDMRLCDPYYVPDVCK